MCLRMTGLPSTNGVGGRTRVMGAGIQALQGMEGDLAFPLGEWNATDSIEAENNRKSVNIYHSEHLMSSHIFLLQQL